MTDKLLLTPEQAAEQLGISRRQIYRLIREGSLRSVKIGKLRRVSRTALQAFIDAGEAAGQPVDAK